MSARRGRASARRRATHTAHTRDDVTTCCRAARKGKRGKETEAGRVCFTRFGGAGGGGERVNGGARVRTSSARAPPKLSPERSSRQNTAGRGNKKTKKNTPTRRKLRAMCCRCCLKEGGIRQLEPSAGFGCGAFKSTLACQTLQRPSCYSNPPCSKQRPASAQTPKLRLTNQPSTNKKNPKPSLSSTLALCTHTALSTLLTHSLLFLLSPCAESSARPSRCARGR